MGVKKVDKIIFGAGMYGLYFALQCAQKNQRIIVLEYDGEAFSRASYINQSKVHNGYHYPRSYATAQKSAQYFERFSHDFDFCINRRFKSIYATSNLFSWVNATQFNQFCTSIDVQCNEIEAGTYFKEGYCDGAFETQEYSFDAVQLKNYFLKQLSAYSNCEIIYHARTSRIQQLSDHYEVALQNGEVIESEFIFNASYGSINQILSLAGLPLFDIKYELCEMILCEVSDNIKHAALTLMDGPFFSLMPFGNTGLHSLSTVAHTPHKTSHDDLPKFGCQAGTACNTSQLQNCNTCINKPSTHWSYMHQLVKKYLKEEIELKYVRSLFSIKAILNSSEIDDSRPTVIKENAAHPYFYSVLSGKINSIYDLDEIIL